VLAGLGYTITGTHSFIEPVVFDEDFDSKFMECVIPAGNCVGIRIVAEIETAQGVTARSEIEVREFKEDDIEHMFWEVNGDPRARVRVEREDSSYMSAACLFNRIPDVIAAAPGVQPVSRLGPLKSTALKY
jgi:4-hydroxy-tetrahydrodipicolinate reductase